jgi:hypothetical protein
MTTQKKIIVVNSSHGYWSGIYLDNELWTEHHSLDTQDWAEIINNHHLESVDVEEVQGDWLEECGNLPQKYQDIPKGVFV